MKKTGVKKIAARYVKALLAVAENAKVRTTVEKDLATLAEAAKTSDTFKSLLANPLLSGKQMAKIMSHLLQSVKAHEVTLRLVLVLSYRKRLQLLPEIAVLYAQAVAEERGEMKAELITAVKLSLKHIQSISDELSKAYGKTVSLEAKEDPKLLGGAVLRVGSQQLDSSVSGKLKRLEQKLKAA